MSNRIRSFLLGFFVLFVGFSPPEAAHATRSPADRERTISNRITLRDSAFENRQIDDTSLHQLAGISISLLAMGVAEGFDIPDSIGVISAGALAIVAGIGKEVVDSFGLGTPESRDIWNTSLGAGVAVAFILFGGAWELADAHLFAGTSILCSVPIILFYVDRLLEIRSR